MEKNDYWIGPGDYSYVKLPYPTGTIVETVESPFFQPVKGVVVNRKEPWEEGFAGEEEQWLLYADFLLPFRQFLRRREGGLEKQEQWLAALGDLLRKDKRCFVQILKDQMPQKTAGANEKCQTYVDNLSKRWDRQTKIESQRENGYTAKRTSNHSREGHQDE